MFRLDLPRPPPVSVQVFDGQGRLVRALRFGNLGAGAHRIAWDGRGVGGRSVASGVYFVRARAAPMDVTLRIVLLR